MLFISHNLDLVAEVCDRVFVMYAGQVVESGAVETLFETPRHPYTRQLLRCIPRLDGGRGPMATIPGLPPRSGCLPPGCAFEPRCDVARRAAAWSARRTGASPGTQPGTQPSAWPHAGGPPDCALGTFFELRGIRKEYALRRGLFQRLTQPARRIAAVDGVSLSIEQGSIIGLVGESGSGKSTLAQIMVRLIEPSSGQLLYRGADVAGLSRGAGRTFRHSVQMVFQDSHSSLNPRKGMRRVLSEALYARGLTRPQARGEIEGLVDRVGLDLSLLDRFPHELSGGQRQRIGIARALAMAPEILVADEPVSSLDVSLQGQIINLLQDLNQKLGLTIVLISHDLAIVARICSAIAVMNAGRIVESGPPERVLVAPSDPYTRTLLQAVPRGLAGRRAPSRVATRAPREAMVSDAS